MQYRNESIPDDGTDAEKLRWILVEILNQLESIGRSLEAISERVERGVVTYDGGS